MNAIWCVSLVWWRETFCTNSLTLFIFLFYFFYSEIAFWTKYFVFSLSIVIVSTLSNLYHLRSSLRIIRYIWRHLHIEAECYIKHTIHAWQRVWRLKELCLFVGQISFHKHLPKPPRHPHISTRGRGKGWVEHIYEQAHGQLLSTCGRRWSQAQTPRWAWYCTRAYIYQRHPQQCHGSGMEGNSSTGVARMVVVPSMVNTKVNCRFKISNLDGLSENSRSPLHRPHSHPNTHTRLSGEMPVLITMFGIDKLSERLNVIIIESVVSNIGDKFAMLTLHSSYLVLTVSRCFHVLFFTFWRSCVFSLESRFKANGNSPGAGNVPGQNIFVQKTILLTEESWSDWLYPLLKSQTSALRDPQPGLEKKWSVLGAFLVKHWAKLQLQDTAAWPDSPGMP